MPHLGGPGVTLGWLGGGPVRPQPEGMTILLHPTAYRAASDEQLVDLVRAGDDRAFDAIHARFASRRAGGAIGSVSDKRGSSIGGSERRARRTANS